MDVMRFLSADAEERDLTLQIAHLVNERRRGLDQELANRISNNIRGLFKRSG